MDDPTLSCRRPAATRARHGLPAGAGRALQARAARIAAIGGFRLCGGDLALTAEAAALIGLETAGTVPLATFLAAFPERERARVAGVLAGCRTPGCGVAGACSVEVAGGARVVHVEAMPDGEDPSGAAVVGLLQDVSRRRGQERALWTLANVDDLTGLWNRKRFVELLEAVAGPGSGLLVIDVDKLKDVNDTLGHGVGDALIRGVAARIRSALGPGQEAARLGGDEFAVVVPECAEDATLAETARRILAACAEPIVAQGHAIVPSVSIGGARDGACAEVMRGNADIALYHAKETGRGRYAAYRPTIRSAILARLEQVRTVSDVLAAGAVSPRFMPVVRLSDRYLCGFETLARLDVEGEPRSPGRYPAALVDPRIGHALTTRMLEAIAGDLARFRARGLAFDKLGLNVTLADFERGDLEERIARTFGAAGVPMDALVVEVTERVFLDGDTGSIARTAARLRARGVRISLDDFGTGFASLTHLRTFPLDTIKVDGSFVSRITEDRASHAIVSGLVDLAARLEIDLVAEGIETAEQLALLEALGCPFGQGYLFAPPLPFEEACGFLERLDTGMRTPIAA